MSKHRQSWACATPDTPVVHQRLLLSVVRLANPLLHLNEYGGKLLPKVCHIKELLFVFTPPCVALWVRP